MLGFVPRFVLLLLGAVLALSALALPEQSRAGCSPNLHWTDFGPVWSPTGDKIAYQRIEIGCFGPRRTYVIDADEGAPVPMPLGGERPSWSPDGRRLAFSANLTVANADGSGYEELRRYPSRHPTWSPDGRFIAFGGGGWETPDIYTIGSDGADERDLGLGADLAWSPDGSRIAFVDYGDHCPSRRGLYVAAVDRTKERRLTNECRLTGTLGDDRIRGSIDDDLVDALAGNDRILALFGSDRVDAGEGNDVVIADQGQDMILGGPGNDRLDGDMGADRIVGGPGRDRLSGGHGIDRIMARDGEVDRISCGPHRDVVIADRRDRVGRACERVRRA